MVYASLDQFKMLFQGFIYQLAEGILILCQQPCSLFKADSLRAVTAFVCCMAGSLVGKKINVDVMIYGVLEKSTIFP